MSLDGVSVVLGGRTLWLDEGGQRVPVVRLRYEEGRLRDRIEVAGRSYDVPRGQGKALKRLLAEHRLRPTEGVPAIVEHAYVEERAELEALGLRSWLEVGELVLAYLHTTTDTEVVSELGPRHDVPWRFVWTERRAALLAVGPLGDLVAWPLDAFAVQSRPGRDLVTGSGPEGELTWRTTLANEERFRAIAPLLDAHGRVRLRAVIEASRAEHRAAAIQLLAHDRGPEAPIERALLEGRPPPISEAFIGALSPDAMVSWSEAWAFGPDADAALIDALQAFDPASAHALALSEHRWRAALAADRVDADLRRAAHLRTAGALDEARAVLEASLAELPAPEVAELVPPADLHAHLTARARLLEALAPLDPGAYLRLARLEPLSVERLTAAVGHDDAGRVSRTLEILAGAFEAPAGVAGQGKPLGDAELAALRHPMSATDRFARMLQGLVATVETPDHSALRRYCAPLQRPDAVAAFEQARSRLGVDAGCYVSRGEDATGCRAYDDPGARFVVLGARHVDEGTLRMSADELRFVFGCELAHLRLGHTRVTQSDMWRGLLDKGLSGAELVLMALPLFRKVRIPEAVGTLLGAVKDGKVGQAWDKASELFRRDSAAKPEDGAVEREALLVTHRLMQLSADRIGLALVGDPGPALRSMVVLRGEYDLAGVAADGLAGWVLRRTEQGELVDPDLAVRVTALLSTWLDRPAEVSG